MIHDVCLILEGISNFNKIGGVSSWLRDLIGGLPEINFSVINFSNQKNTISINEEYKNLKYFKNIQVTDYPFSVEDILLLMKNIYIPDADIFHSTSTGCASLYGIYLSELYKKPLLLTEHAIYWKEALETHELECGIKFNESEAVEILKIIAKNAYKKAFMITSPTNFTRALQTSNGADPDKCTIIKNGIDTSKYKFIPDRFPPNRIGFVGRITRIKNIELILEIFVELIRMKNDYKFYIIGPIDDIEYFKELKKRSLELGLDKYITFTGGLERDKWSDLIDILIMTSKMETQPYVILEALSSGVLPVVNNVGGISETINNAGILFQNNTQPDIIASSILEISDNEALYIDKIALGRRNIEKYNNLADMIISFNNLYNRAELYE